MTGRTNDWMSEKVPMTILVVDDEEAVGRTVSTMLKRHGYNVVCANSALDALGKWRTHQDVVDLVLTDFHLGTPTATDLIDAIREEGGDIPFLLMTGNISTQEEAEVRPKVVDVLRKPIRYGKLLVAVTAALVKVVTEE